MQFLGGICLLLCVAAMLLTIAQMHEVALTLFVIALSFMATSLFGLIIEIWISGGALRIMLKALEESQKEEMENLNNTK